MTGRPVYEIAHAELRNWSRWCWTGAWPHPSLWGINPKEAFESECDSLPPNEERALRVQAVYARLLLVDQRILQAEYPRRHEYRAQTPQELRQEASRHIGVTPEYYAAALARAKAAVLKEFER